LATPLHRSTDAPESPSVNPKNLVSHQLPDWL
jgi:hypothetical protein